jgi:mono/diheme cytochrome c family protein
MVAELLIAAAVGLYALAAAAQQDGALEQHGKALLLANCSRCHAIERSGTSPHPQAPPFRGLEQRYPIDSLAEALGEGLLTGHPDMPEFVFEIADVSAILAYLKSIQDSNPQEPR